MWRCLAYLFLAPAYLALASGVFLGVSFVASLIVSSPTYQVALTLIGTGIVLTASVKLVKLLDE